MKSHNAKRGTWGFAEGTFLIRKDATTGTERSEENARRAQTGGYLAELSFYPKKVGKRGSSALMGGHKGAGVSKRIPVLESRGHKRVSDGEKPRLIWWVLRGD